jgi:hypothetical protein
MSKHYYEHYQGDIYAVLDECTNSETSEKMVIYKNLKDSKLWVRPRELFFGEVEPGVKRFRKITAEEAFNKIRRKMIEKNQFKSCY